jgi:hypothetical protein
MVTSASFLTTLKSVALRHVCYCNNPDDSAVWYYNDWNLEIKLSHATVLDWLYSFATEAERAIASGYFDMSPKGTRP